MTISVELNKKIFHVNYSQRLQSFTHKRKIGLYERIIALLKDLPPLARRCLFFSQTRNGFIAINSVRHYDANYFLNTAVKHAGNIHTSVGNFGAQNIKWDFGASRIGERLESSTK